MKITDKLIDKFGSDKLLHFLVAGWLTQIATLLGFPCTIIVICLILLFSIIKEKLWDSTFDLKDIYAAILGSFVALLLLVIL